MIEVTSSRTARLFMLPRTVTVHARPTRWESVKLGGLDGSTSAPEALTWPLGEAEFTHDGPGSPEGAR